MLIAALLRRLDGPGHAVDRLLDQLPGAVEDLDGLRREHGDFTIVEINNVFRMRDQSGHIGSKEILPHADTEDQRACLTHGVKRVRRVGAEDPQSVGALQSCRSLHDGGFDIAVVVFLQ